MGGPDAGCSRCSKKCQCLPFGVCVCVCVCVFFLGGGEFLCFKGFFYVPVWLKFCDCVTKTEREFVMNRVELFFG